MGNYERDFIEKMREDIQIPEMVDDKLNEIYGMIREDKVQMKQSGFARSRRRFYRTLTATAAAACAVVALSGIFYVNPALARDIPILGDVFGRLQEVRNNSEYPSKDNTAYENIKEHSTPVQEAGNSAENELGVMTVSDAYCDGYDIYFTLSLRVEDEELKTAEYFSLMHKNEGDDFLYPGGKYMVDQKETMTSVIAGLKKAEDGVYVGLGRIEERDEAPFGDQMTVNLDINGLEIPSPSGIMDEYKQVEGDWVLQFDVKMDTSSNRTAEPNAENNGIIVQKAVQTPSNMHVTCYLPAELAEKNPAFALSDGNGNRVQMETGKGNEQEDGSQILEFVFNTSQADEFIMRVYDKNAGTADENGMPPLIAEIPFTM